MDKSNPKRGHLFLEKIIPDFMLQQYGNFFFLTRCNYETKMLSLKELSSFFRSILVSWHDFKKSKRNEADFKNEILWNNRKCEVDQKPVFFIGDGFPTKSSIYVIYLTDIVQWIFTT